MVDKTPLQEILEIYKEELKVEEDLLEIEEEKVKALDLPKEKGREIEPLKDVKEGQVIEVFPSVDGLEMVFLVFKIYKNGFVEILPISKFWEFATPDDALIKLNGKPYIVQTDLGFDVPKEDFAKRFSPRRVFLVGTLDEKQMEEVRAVYEGKKKGAGRMYGGPKEEFKRLESKRYFKLFSEMIAMEEAKNEISAFFEEHKQETLVAAEKEQTWGSKEGVDWFYDSKDQKLILVPNQELVGREKRIFIEAGGEKITLFEGDLPEKIEIPLEPGSYSYTLLEKGLRVEDV